MWRLWHKLFGWDYVAWANIADQGVARVRTDGMNRAYYCRYKSTSVYDLIHNRDQVVWLTCIPDKYMKEK